MMSARDVISHNERVLACIGALAGSGPLTRIGTSRKAATPIASAISERQRRVLDFIRSRGASGCTDLDLQHRFGNHGSTFRTWRAELVALGLLRDSGVRIMQDNGLRIVWVAAEYAGECSTSSHPVPLAPSTSL